MGLETTFQGFWISLSRLQDAFDALEVTVKDKLNHEAALADGLEEALLDMNGTLNEVRKAAFEAKKAVGHPPDLDQARRSLTVSQDSFHRLERQFAAELVSYDKLHQLAQLGSRGKQWSHWAHSIEQGIEQCREPIEVSNKALASCWQELAEKAGGTSISIRNAVVGQKVNRSSGGNSAEQVAQPAVE
jgi:hypothetical protein